MLNKATTEGSIYRVKFLDHSIGSRVPIVCEMVGFLLEQNDTHYLFTTWITHDDEEDSNMELISIIKSTITDIDELDTTIRSDDPILQ